MDLSAENLCHSLPTSHSNGSCAAESAAEKALTTCSSSNSIVVDATSPISSTAASASGGKGGGKHANAAKNINSTTTGVGSANVHFEQKFNIDTELLGSVITHNCPGVRTSARVIQKMKQDQIRPTTPPPQSEREHKNSKEPPSLQKTPSHIRAHKPIWTNIERNHFFDALNEFGKDFESIGNYINTKLKRKCGTDIAFKSKDQVRQHYYQTFHKICKYIRFSDEVKKPAQELYALTNYGEMRRKLQFVTDKHFIKLKSLVYQGQIIVRWKGKNIRIKTPSCKALRRLNQLDDSLEDIRLPSKIEVIVSPANMESFGRVQSIAQNPRVRVTVPLHKKLLNFIKTFQHKWRSNEMKCAEEELKLFPNADATTTTTTNDCQTHERLAPAYQDAPMCFLPKPGVTIHRPLLSITEYLSSVNICLAAYEERMGVKVRGESLSGLERGGGSAGGGGAGNKRQRTESGSDKRSPDGKKQKHSTESKSEVDAATAASLLAIKEELSENVNDSSSVKHDNSGSDCNADELSDELNDLLSDTDNSKYEPKCFQLKEETNIVAADAVNATPPTNASTPTTSRAKRAASGGAAAGTSGGGARAALNFKPLISDAVIRRIRSGWTVANAADITIGDLYVVFGQDSKLELDYNWTDSAETAESSAAATAATQKQKMQGLPYNQSDCDDPQLLQNITKSSVSNKLKHLLLIANLSERIRKRQCSCGHTCDRNSSKARIERDLATKTFISNKTFLPNTAASTEGSSPFRQPIAPIRRPVFQLDTVKQISTFSRPKMSRQVLVQRLLLPGGVNHAELSGNPQSSVIDKAKLMAQMQKAPTGPPPNFAANALSTARRKSFALSHKRAELPNVVADTTCTAAQHTDANAPALEMSTAQQEEILEALLNATAPDDEPLQQTSANALSCDVSNAAIATTTTTLEDVSELSTSASQSADSAFDENSNSSVFNGMSSMHFTRDTSSNSRWLEENLNDFSLTSLLGHLDEINASRDILDPSSNLSVISETSVDYMSKFQEITALMRSQDSD